MSALAAPLSSLAGPVSRGRVFGSTMPETLIAQLDANPFNVDTKLSKVITVSLKHMNKSIG